MKKIVLAKNRDKSTVGWESIPSDVQKNVGARVVQDAGVDPEFLKAGSKGSIYLLTTGNILKITSDESEADAAEIIKQNPNENFYTVLDVFEIDADFPLFGLLLGRLEDADPEWELFGDIFNSWHTDMTNALDAKNPEHTQIYLLPPIMGVFKKFIEKKYGQARFEEQLNWLQKITEYLLENEILFLDVHGGNIMKDPETQKHVLIDLGYGETPEVKLPLVTAQTNRLIMAKKLIIMAERLLQGIP